MYNSVKFEEANASSSFWTQVCQKQSLKLENVLNQLTLIQIKLLVFAWQLRCVIRLVEFVVFELSYYNFCQHTWAKSKTKSCCLVTNNKPAWFLFSKWSRSDMQEQNSVRLTNHVYPYLMDIPNDLRFYLELFTLVGLCI